MSPAARSLLSQPAISVVVPSGCSTQWRPRAPGWPPLRPKAGTLRWLGSVLTVISSRKRRRRAAPAPPGARAAAAVTDRVGLKADRVAPFEDFGVGEAGVRHLRLDHVGAVEALACSRAARDRLVVLVPIVAERHVVHRARAFGHGIQRGVDRAGD